MALIAIQLLFICLMLGFVWINISYAFRREKLPASVTDVAVKFIFRKKTTPLVSYIGWLGLNFIFRHYVKALKHCGASYADAKNLIKKTRELLYSLKNSTDDYDGLDVEFKATDFEKFAGRDRKGFYACHGAVFVPPIRKVGNFALGLDDRDEMVLRATIHHIATLIKSIPVIGKWGWVDKLFQKCEEYTVGIRGTLRKHIFKNFKVYSDNMMRMANQLGNIENMKEWSDAEELLAQTLDVEPIVANKDKISCKWNSFGDKVNNAGRNMFLAMVRVEGFKLEQKDYIDIEITDGVAMVATDTYKDIEPGVAKVQVLVEGQTDEAYFKSAIEAYGLDVPIEYRWVGYIDTNGQERFTGESSLKNALNFIRGQDLRIFYIVQYDCDKAHGVERDDKVIVRSVAKYNNSCKINKGTENALVLDSIDKSVLDGFYVKKEIDSGYGKIGEKYELKKKEMCDYICGLSKEKRKEIFPNLKREIDAVMELLKSR